MVNDYSETKVPYLMDLQAIGSSKIGFLTFAEHPSVPFDVKRVYWTYLTPDNFERGGHAHKELEQFIVAVSGNIDFNLESKDGFTFNFTLDHPTKALYVPSGYWRTFRFQNNAVLLCLASLKYNKEDYIRDYSEFKKLK